VSTVLAALVSGVLAALVSLAAYVSPALLALAVAFVVALVAIGWALLLDLPDPRGTAVVVAVSGWVGVGATYAIRDTARSLGVFSGLIAFAVILAFAHELFRRGEREDLVESLTGTLTGQVIAMLGGGWILLPMTSLEQAGVVITATALGVTRLAGVFGGNGRFLGWVSFGLGTVAGTVVAAVLGYGDTASLMLATSVAGTVAGMDRLLSAQPASRTSLGAVTGAAAPTAAIGTVAFAMAILLAGW
jgi:uncharacterized membrane protein YGL010W